MRRLFVGSPLIISAALLTTIAARGAEPTTSGAATLSTSGAATSGVASSSVASSGAASSGTLSSGAAASGTGKTSSDAQPAAVDPSKPPRVLFVIGKDCPRCERELARLRRPGGDFEKMRSRGWKIGPGPENHLQIVDRGTLGELAELLGGQELPKVICVRDQEIVRSFQSGCTTPLDMWTFGWLIKGIDERPPGFVPEKARVESAGHYPLRGNHWSIDEDWNPSRERVVAHLRGPTHGHQISVSYEIETWSYEELRSLHDNLHEQEMGGISYGSYGARAQPSNPFSATRKVTGH